MIKSGGGMGKFQTPVYNQESIIRKMYTKSLERKQLEVGLIIAFLGAEKQNPVTFSLLHEGTFKINFIVCFVDIDIFWVIKKH